MSARPGDMSLAGDLESKLSKHPQVISKEYNADQIVMDVQTKEVGVGSEIISVEPLQEGDSPFRNETLESTLSHTSDKQDFDEDYPREADRNSKLRLDADNLRKLDAHADSIRARK